MCTSTAFVVEMYDSGIDTLKQILMKMRHIDKSDGSDYGNMGLIIIA